MKDTDLHSIERGFCAAVEAYATDDSSARITRASLERCRAYVRAWVAEHAPMVADALQRGGYDAHSLGWDLYLTAVGAGAGFWDREELNDGDDTGQSLGERMSDSTHGQNWRRWWLDVYASRGWIYVQHRADAVPCSA